MAIVIRKPGQIGALLRRQLERDRDLVARVALETAQRGLAKAIAETDRQGLVDRGTFKLSWKAERVPGGAELRNDAPYAAVIEYGRRPGRPGPPLAPILAWVHRKLVANGQVQEVRGDGVVGEQPYLEPGQGFRYTSGAVLETPVGAMQGSYEMLDADGITFDAPIAPFTLAMPGTIH